jgi:signal transduction histidine kinase
MYDRILTNRLAVLFGATALVFAVLVVAVLTLSWLHYQKLREQSYDQSGLAAIQLRVHYERLLTRLTEIEADSNPSAFAQAATEFDILYGRLRDLPQRPPYDVFLDDEVKQLVADLFALVDAKSDAFDRAIQSGSPAMLVAFRTELEPLRAQVERAAGRAVQLATDYREEARRHLMELFAALVAVIAGLCLSGLSFAVVSAKSLRAEARRARALLAMSGDLREARDASQAASHAKSEFLARMSHELRTPLNAILGFSDMIRGEAFGPISTRKYVEYGEVIHTSGGHLLGLVNDILDFAKIEAGAMVLHEGETPIANLLDEVAGYFALLADQRHLAIACRYPDEALKLRADSFRIRQIMLNLVSNSVKFTRPGGIVTLSAARLDDGGVELAVTDTGIGIAAQDLPGVTLPFSQIPQDITTSREGAGLGLAIVKAIVEMHGGMLTIESVVGTGTRAAVRFPAARTIAAAPAIAVAAGA